MVAGILRHQSGLRPIQLPFDWLHFVSRVSTHLLEQQANKSFPQTRRLTSEKLGLQVQPRLLVESSSHHLPGQEQ